MKCKDTQELLIAYTNGELEKPLWDGVRRHMAVCRSCREEMDSLEQAQTKLRKAFNCMVGERAQPSGAWTSLQRQIATDKEHELVRVLPRKGTGSIFGKFSLKWAAPSVAIVAIAVTLALILPPMLGEDTHVLATNIALANPAVQAALNGVVPVKMAVTDNFGFPGTSRVVMAVPPTQAVIADVDMNTKQVTKVTVQNSSEIQEQQVLDVANADPRVRDALGKGYHFEFNRVAELYTEPPTDWELIEPYRRFGAKPQDMVGFLGFLNLKDDNPDPLQGYYYSVVVNVSLSRVVVFEGPNKFIQLITTTYHMTTALPKLVFAAPDPGTVNGNLPNPRSVMFIEHTPYHLKVGVFDKETNRCYATWTWDVTQADIEKLLELAKTDTQVQALLAKGARFSAVTPTFSSGSHSDSSGTTYGITWGGNVRIDLGEISYHIGIDLTSERVRPLTAGSLKGQFHPDDIILP